LWVEKKVLDLMDQILCEVYNVDQLMKCINIGLLCIQDDPNDRPTMSNVVTMLDSEAKIVPTPKRPSLVQGQAFLAQLILLLEWTQLQNQPLVSEEHDTNARSRESVFP
jgi:hypothetical protein